MTPKGKVVHVPKNSAMKVSRMNGIKLHAFLTQALGTGV
jgi:hypothetical protein